MFDVKIINSNQVFISGRLNASVTSKLVEALETIKDNCIIDFKGLEYISSAGLGELIQTYSRLKDSGKSLKLINMNSHIREVFKICGLDKVFTIE